MLPHPTSLFAVLPAPACDLPLHGAAQARALEHIALQQSPPHALMRRAGEAVAKLALAIAPHARSIWVAAGPGNNGGDGAWAALHLHRLGKQVRLGRMQVAKNPPAGAVDAWSHAQQAGVPIVPLADGPPPGCDLAIDALLGLGSDRAPDGEIAGAIDQLRRLQRPVLSVDLPSGLCGDTGRVLGEQAVVARHTLALLSLKPGLFTGKGRDHAGQVWWDRLGVAMPTGQPDAWLVGRQSVEAMQPSREHGSHKGTFGDVVVVGGAEGMAGAAWLCGQAALAVGAGRVYVDCLSPAPLAANAASELMQRSDTARDSPLLARATVVAGCGGGAAIAYALPGLLQHAARLVIDADGLNAVAAEEVLQQALRDRAGRRLTTVLTPHPLEAARLLGCEVAQVQADRLRAAKALGERLQAVVVLKGSGSVCVAPGQAAYINPTGNARLATAGTGDVLAGWLAGLWATATAERSPLRIAAAAVWQHGWAARAPSDVHVRGSLRASQLINQLADDLARGA